MRKVQTTDVSQISTANTSSRYPIDAVIVISYVGYKTQELKGDQLVEKIVLEEDAVALDELVVVGYAVQKKKELTGSTSSLKASDKSFR